jgi:hypothetical protein
MKGLIHLLVQSLHDLSMETHPEVGHQAPQHFLVQSSQQSKLTIPTKEHFKEKLL